MFNLLNMNDCSYHLFQFCNVFILIDHRNKMNNYVICLPTKYLLIGNDKQLN